MADAGPKTPNIVANLTDELNQYLDLARGHAAVHPDRNQCGGVGGCLMLRTEVDQLHEIEDTYLAGIAAAGYRLVITVQPEARNQAEELK